MRLPRFFRRRTSREVAKDRLKILLISDRVNCSPEVLELIKKDIARVISRYMLIDAKKHGNSRSANRRSKAEGTKILPFMPMSRFWICTKSAEKTTGAFMFKRYKLKNFDFILVLLVISLNIIGILVIGSAKESVQGTQIFGMFLGLAAMMVVAFMDYSFLLRFQWIWYLFIIGSLVLVALFGEEVNGATRWLDIGLFRFQPSETTKILLILFYAQFIMKYREKLNTFRILFCAIILVIPPLVLIYEQPNLSMTILTALLFCAILFVGGLSWKIIGGVLAIIVPSALIFYPL